MTEKVKNEVNRICSSLDINDYYKYLSGELTYGELLCRYQCTNYIMLLSFKILGLCSRDKHIKKKLNEHIFDDINSEQAAYVLGFYIADGSISHHRIQFSLNEKDILLLEKIRDIISPNSKIYHYPEKVNKHGVKSHSMCSFSVTSKYLCSKLESYGLGYKKTYLTKSIINIIPTDFMWDFIRGYFDGDGCISSSIVKHKINNKDYYNINVNWTIISHDKSILKELQDFISTSLNIIILLYPTKKGNYLMGTHKIKNLPLIFNKLYANSSIYLERKYLKFKDIIANTEVRSRIAKGLDTP